MGHSWYKKDRRHYGPKPNTRRERGLPNRNRGKPRPKLKKELSALLPSVGIDTNVEMLTKLPSIQTIKKYAKIYNFYMQQYDLYRDKEICVEYTIHAFRCTKAIVTKAIKVCKYLLATTTQNNGT